MLCIFLGGFLWDSLKAGWFVVNIQRGEGGKVGGKWPSQSTLLSFTVGLADTHSFTSPVRQTSKFLIAGLLKLCKPHYLPRGETKTKLDDLPGWGKGESPTFITPTIMTVWAQTCAQHGGWLCHLEVHSAQLMKSTLGAVIPASVTCQRN